MMTFTEYCLSKNIDASKFQAEEPSLWTELEIVFNQVHPNSFTAQKKFLINPIRLKYQLPEGAKPDKKEVKKGAPKVKIPGAKTNPPSVPKPKTGTSQEKPSLKPKMNVSPKKSGEPKPTSALKPKIGGSKTAALKPKITASQKEVTPEKKVNPLKPKMVTSTKPNALKPKIEGPKKETNSPEKKPSALKPIIRPKKD